MNYAALMRMVRITEEQRRRVAELEAGGDPASRQLHEARQELAHQEIAISTAVEHRAAAARRNIDLLAKAIALSPSVDFGLCDAVADLLAAAGGSQNTNVDLATAMALDEVVCELDGLRLTAARTPRPATEAELAERGDQLQHAARGGHAHGDN